VRCPEIANYQIPIVQYAELQLDNAKGLQECYMFSDFKAFATFSRALADHYKVLSKSKSEAKPIPAAMPTDHQ
jgi:hypothetical protein